VVQQEVLERIADSKVRVFFVWTPVLREDDRYSAVKAIANLTDERALHFWDPDKSLGMSLGEAVVLPRGRELAWDVYFVFDSRSQWTDLPPNPAEWMHQLGIDDRTLDGGRLRIAVENLLKSVER